MAHLNGIFFGQVSPLFHM